MAGLLGQIGEGESLAPGIAHTMFEKRKEIELLFEEHDKMVAEAVEETVTPIKATVAKFSKMPTLPAR
ncbi:MAG: hypothetical protein AAGH57_02345 [Pseudomonadota bacterium]